MKNEKEPKQETIEEAAEKYAEIYRCPATNENEYCKHDIISAFNKGAKWQAERMYSEQEVISILYEQLEALDYYGKDFQFDKFFEQFRKK